MSRKLSQFHTQIGNRFRLWRGQRFACSREINTFTTFCKTNHSLRCPRLPAAALPAAAMCRGHLQQLPKRCGCDSKLSRGAESRLLAQRLQAHAQKIEHFQRVRYGHVINVPIRNVRVYRGWALNECAIEKRAALAQKLAYPHATESSFSEANLDVSCTLLRSCSIVNL